MRDNWKVTPHSFWEHAYKSATVFPLTCVCEAFGENVCCLDIGKAIVECFSFTSYVFVTKANVDFVCSLCVTQSGHFA